MVKRSLRASPLGIEQAKRAFAHKGWTQENLAGEVGLKTRQSIWRFFTGQPIERQVFLEICLILDLDWREIAVDPPAPFPEHDAIANPPVADIDTLVRQVRAQRQDKIQDQCGTLKLLDISRPVKLDDIYIDVNTLEEIPSQQWLELADLQRFTPKEFDRFGLEEVSQTQISGMKAVEIYSKLRVLGKPGAGKTTFLQYLAIRCNRGSFADNRVPVFVTLRDFADEAIAADELSLFNYMREEFLTSGISDPSIIETLLREGRVLVLLDGLDEVLEQERKAVVKEIRRLSEKYQKNLFVVTCRTAVTVNLNRFTDVEIAPFTQNQIEAFAQKWFTALTKTEIGVRQEQAVQFIQKLELAENLPLRKLAVTPLFLHLACWVFHYQGKFPTKRSEFYKQCLDLLLSKWDETKGIERDEVCHGFLLPQKLKLLSQVATVTFEQGDYFFEQQVVEQHIGDYIRALQNASTEPEELQLASESILKAIELQHGLLAERVRGIFSFSYQIFQEYFTARKIVASHNMQASDRSLERLVSHMTEPRWREIFLLTVAMLRSADALVQLMKQHIDAIAAQDPYLQKFLTWASQAPLVPSPSTANRASYLALARTPHIAPPHFVLACTLDQASTLNAALDHLVVECTVDFKSNAVDVVTAVDAGAAVAAACNACNEALNTALAIVLDSELHQALQQLKDQLSAAMQSRETLQAWWQSNYPAWLERLKSSIAKYRNACHDWHFSLEQQELLQRYYDANQLLLDCLNSNCEVTAVVRQEIEAALLLPKAELEEQERSNSEKPPASQERFHL